METATIEREARAWLSIQLGDRPLVPPEVGDQGTPREIIEAGRSRLAELRRAKARTAGLGRRVRLAEWDVMRPARSGEGETFEGATYGDE